MIFLYHMQLIVHIKLFDNYLVIILYFIQYVYQYWKNTENTRNEGFVYDRYKF